MPIFLATGKKGKRPVKFLNNLCALHKSQLSLFNGNFNKGRSSWVLDTKKTYLNEAIWKGNQSFVDKGRIYFYFYLLGVFLKISLEIFVCRLEREKLKCRSEESVAFPLSPPASFSAEQIRRTQAFSARKHPNIKFLTQFSQNLMRFACLCGKQPQVYGNRAHPAERMLRRRHRVHIKL